MKLADLMPGRNSKPRIVATYDYQDEKGELLYQLMSQCLTEYLAPMFGEGLVIWTEPCTAVDAEMRLKWAETLARHLAISGDELRELSPFDLKLEYFPEPVLSLGRDPRLDEAMGKLDESMSDLKSFDVPVYADRIVTASRVMTNGKVVSSQWRTMLSE